MSLPFFTTAVPDTLPNETRKQQSISMLHTKAAVHTSSRHRINKNAGYNIGERGACVYYTVKRCLMYIIAFDWMTNSY